MFCILYRRKLDNNIKLDAFSARSSEILPPTQALLTGWREQGADGSRTRQLGSLRFFRRHLCPVKLTYCNVRSAIGRSSDFDRQVCRGRDNNKKERKNQRRSKIKRAEYSKNNLESSDLIFYGSEPWIWFRFSDTKSMYIDILSYVCIYIYIISNKYLCARKTHTTYYSHAWLSLPIRETWRKLIVT